MKLGKVAWVTTLVSLLLGPLFALAGIGMALVARPRGGDWQPTVALGLMVILAWVSLAILGLAMGG